MTCTVVSVMPYMLMSCGRSSPRRSYPAAQLREFERLAAEDHAPQRQLAACAAPRPAMQLREGSRRLVQNRHALVAEQLRGTPRASGYERGTKTSLPP